MYESEVHVATNRPQDNVVGGANAKTRARTADHGIAFGVRPERTFRGMDPRQEIGKEGAGTDAGLQRIPGQGQAALRNIALHVRPLRGAAVDPRAGGPSLPQNELLEIQGERVPPATRSSPAPRNPDGQ